MVTILDGMVAPNHRERSPGFNEIGDKPGAKGGDRIPFDSPLHPYGAAQRIDGIESGQVHDRASARVVAHDDHHVGRIAQGDGNKAVAQMLKGSRVVLLVFSLDDRRLTQSESAFVCPP